MDPASPNKAIAYVTALVVLCVLTVVFVLVLSAIRPTADNMPLIVAVLGVITPVNLALIGAAFYQNHLLMNSRLSELLAQTAKASKAEGQLQGPTL